MTDRTGLAGGAAALDGNDDVVLADGFGRNEGLVHNHLQGFKAEIIIDVSFIDRDGSFAGLNVDTSDGALSSAGSVILICHDLSSSCRLKSQCLRLLSSMRMLRTCVYM